MVSELLRQVRCLDPVTQSDRPVDVWVVKGKIEAIAPSLPDLPSETTIRDSSSLVLGPGLVDFYSHSGEPGHEDRETLATLMQAAYTGGFAQISLLPDTQPVVDQPAPLALLQNRVQRLQATYPVRVHLWGAITLNSAGDSLAELVELAQAGVVGFSETAPQHSLLLRRALEYLHPLGKPVALWPCDRRLQGQGVLREGEDALRLGLPATPAIAETSALKTILECVRLTRTPVHIMRVSTALSVDCIRQAQQEGLPVTASVTWLHLLKSTADVVSYDPSLRLDPPLGTPTDQTALIQGLQDGVLEAIAIDHQAYTYEEKTVAFAEAPPGTLGLDQALVQLWQHLVVPGQLTALQLWTALSARPAQWLGHPLEAIQWGDRPRGDQPIILFEPQSSDPANQPHLGRVLNLSVQGS